MAEAEVARLLRVLHAPGDSLPGKLADAYALADHLITSDHIESLLELPRPLQQTYLAKTLQWLIGAALSKGSGLPSHLCFASMLV